jgi:hypothetical protein
MFELRERCSCGAEFGIRDAPLTDAKRLLREWRRVHVCEQVEPEVSMVASTTNAVVERSDSVLGFRWSEPVEFEEDKR